MVGTVWLFSEMFLSMSKWLLVITGCVAALSARATVRVFVQDANGVARIQYECTAGEVVRAFALDVTVDQGIIFGISDFQVGVSKPGAVGYGIFPASFRDHATVISGTNVTYDLNLYTPLAVPSDSPGGTLPGLNSSGVTLELGGLWDPAVPNARPAATGILCSLHLSRAANVVVTPNVSRGGIVLSPPDVLTTPLFNGAFVDADAVITSAQVSNGIIALTFKGGELETAPSAAGPWTGTGNSSGIYTAAIANSPTTFYRVHHR